MTQPARKGRRRPDIAQDLGLPDAPEDDSMGAQALGDLEMQQHGEPTDSLVDHEPQLMVEGDIVTAAATLAVDLGDGKTSYFRYAHTTRAQEQEDHVDVYSRVATVVNEGVIGLIDDSKDRLDQYQQMLQERYEAIAAQQRAGQQPRR